MHWPPEVGHGRRLSQYDPQTTPAGQCRYDCCAEARPGFRDAPALELYQDDFAADAKTGTFRCWLCVPVKPR